MQGAVTVHCPTSVYSRSDVRKRNKQSSAHPSTQSIMGVHPRPLPLVQQTLIILDTHICNNQGAHFMPSIIASYKKQISTAFKTITTKTRKIFHKFHLICFL